MEFEPIVIRRNFRDIITTLGLMGVFVAASVIALHMPGTFNRIFGIVGLVFFGVGGFLYFALMSWKPIVIVSNEGISVPRGKGADFVAWENIGKIEATEQSINTAGTTAKQGWIGVYALKTEKTTAGEISENIVLNMANWEEMPALLINTDYSAVDEKFLQTLIEIYNKKKASAQQSSK